MEGNAAYFGLGLQDTPLHRRPWRSLRYTGQLHTTVAAAMARVLDPPSNALIIDPFCGSGTLLAESAIMHPACRHEGWDIKEEALTIARQSAEQAGVQPAFRLRDSLQQSPPGKEYYLLSNPPWDEKHQISDGNIRRFISALDNWTQRSAVSVLLLPEELVLLLEEETGKPLERIATTRVRGKLAEIVKYKKRD
jgi:23S rRNA G2445 N2-methylase RlmL